MVTYQLVIYQKWQADFNAVFFQNFHARQIIFFSQLRIIEAHARESMRQLNEVLFLAWMAIYVTMRRDPKKQNQF